MVTCATCGARPATIGALCEDCREELSIPRSIAPEQLVSSVISTRNATLVDPWGRGWPVDERTLIGRTPASGLAILAGSVSRHHALVLRDLATRTWTIRDLGSSNGTFVNDQLIDGPTPVQSGDRIAIGGVGFYFVERVDLPTQTQDAAAYATIPSTTATDPAPPIPADAFSEAEITNVGLPRVRLRLHEPSGGGGGILEVGNVQTQLSAIQFELIGRLRERMLAESHQPELVRGFVRSSELIGELSWDSRDPAETNVKQLIRRTRRVLSRAGIEDLVEARQRFGYRLKLIPTD